MRSAKGGHDHLRQSVAHFGFAFVQCREIINAWLNTVLPVKIQFPNVRSVSHHTLSREDSTEIKGVRYSSI